MSSSPPTAHDLVRPADAARPGFLAGRLSVGDRQAHLVSPAARTNGRCTSTCRPMARCSPATAATARWSRARPTASGSTCSGPSACRRRRRQEPQFRDLIDPGFFQAERLVNMAKHDYRLEPNVTFSPDMKWIVFRSNMLGPTHVYAVEIARAGNAGSQRPATKARRRRVQARRSWPGIPTTCRIRQNCWSWATRASQPCMARMLLGCSPRDCASASDWRY